MIAPLLDFHLVSGSASLLIDGNRMTDPAISVDGLGDATGQLLLDWNGVDMVTLSIGASFTGNLCYIANHPPTVNVQGRTIGPCFAWEK